jgi:hypothetical protein
MRLLSAKSGFLETSPNGLVRFSAKHPGGARFLPFAALRVGMTQPGKYKNSGNELDKYLKTKNMTL